MSPFERRELPADTLGESIKMVREEDGLTIAELGQRANVQAKYVAAIEAGRYDQTPGPTYVRGFLRSIAEVLNLSADTVVARFEGEPFPTSPGATPHAGMRTFFSYKIIRILGLAAVLLAALVYFGVQITRIVAPPPLAVTQPATDIVAQEPQVLLEGNTEPEVDVTVNGRSIQVDSQGHFSETVDLQPGVNTLVVMARKKRSRTATITRQVLVQLPAVVQ
ncbi:MAG: helix-turn-helix domain-containing protein [Patescibacteria group bacterium]